ncbi:DHHA1 domain-containing protein [Dechloromonas sp. XY25]|uniref:DHHA1 domain-containing protein n=1 Tax=Dechloromonas hankyongensis TaxID=2908002 RepID=A0ABS9K3V7_9RHOO|nr:DHHA1 domain-containing protein [Dechloromonas hankyongensis]MCG2577830.1 DHHA1 domain-containing protein [Dechloromonas hankyongensis]
MAAPVTIIFHADCLDGFGAAYAAWQHYGNAATYRPMHHGERWNMADIAGHDVFVLDFSFPPDTLEQMAGIAKSVTQIDHHASALKDWASHLQDDAAARRFEHPQLPLQVRFDLDKSGARLAWEYFHPDKPVPLTLRHIEDQDMWRFALPDTRAFCRALRLMPFDFETWHRLVVETADPSSPRHIETVVQGTAIETFFQREVERLAQGSLRMPARLRGEPVDALQALRHGQPIVTAGDLAWLALPGLAVNANALFASELGNLLAEQSGSFGIVWQLAADGEVKVSLRSQGKHLDVSVIAARYGGGGHPNAAGFRLPAEQFFSEALNIPTA